MLGGSSPEFYGFVHKQEAVKLTGVLKPGELGTLTNISLPGWVQQTMVGTGVSDLEDLSKNSKSH